MVRSKTSFPPILPLPGRLRACSSGGTSEIADDENIHRHGSSSIKYGRGAVLTVDLTNRCNMMCSPCFMDANQVGLCARAGLSTTSRRSWIARFPLSRGARSSSSFRAASHALALLSRCVPTPRTSASIAILAATNGIRFAQSEEFTRQAHEAGLHGAYLQFDGTTNEKNQHRGVGNLFDVKLQAIENTAKVGMKTTLVTTMVNTINNDTLGPIVDFAMQQYRQGSDYRVSTRLFYRP